METFDRDSPQTCAAPAAWRSAARVAVLLPASTRPSPSQGRSRLPCRAARGDRLLYDNNSSDGTAARAAEAGAVVRREPLQGKGNVVRRMFADVEADVYVLADGDDTTTPRPRRG